MPYHTASNDDSIELTDTTVPGGLGIQHGPDAEQNPQDDETRASAETVLSPTSPRRPLLTPSHGPTIFAPGPKNNILDRRGRSRLECDTAALYAFDAVLTGSIMARSCPAKRLRLSPMFGFDEASITPPIGSPLWRRRSDSAGDAESSKRIMRSKMSSRGPLTISESADRPLDAKGDVYHSAVTVTVASPFDAGRVSFPGELKFSNDG